MIDTGADLLTVRQAARVAGMSETTVVRWIAQNGLGAIRMSDNSWRIRRDVLAKFLNEWDEIRRAKMEAGREVWRHTPAGVGPAPSGIPAIRPASARTAPPETCSMCDRARVTIGGVCFQCRTKRR